MDLLDGIANLIDMHLSKLTGKSGSPCSPWDYKELDTTEWLIWTDLLTVNPSHHYYYYYLWSFMPLVSSVPAFATPKVRLDPERKISTEYFSDICAFIMMYHQQRCFCYIPPILCMKHKFVIISSNHHSHEFALFSWPLTRILNLVSS